MDKEEISQKYKTLRPKIISASLNKFSRYHDAADLLIEAGQELHRRVEHHKIKHGEDNDYIFFMKINKAILHAFNFINDLQFIYERNLLVESENRFLIRQINQISEELNVYQTIEASLLREKLDEKIEIVKRKIETAS